MGLVDGPLSSRRQLIHSDKGSRLRSGCEETNVSIEKHSSSSSACLVPGIDDEYTFLGDFLVSRRLMDQFYGHLYSGEER